MRNYWFAVFTVALAASFLFAAAGDEHAFELKWTPDGFRDNQMMQLDRTEPFNQEPDFGPRKILRGHLDVGASARAEEMGFAWDPDEAKLYVDLNRDGDLTNDPEGVLTSDDARGGQYRVQDFPTFEVTVTTDAGLHRYQVTASMRDYPPSSFAYFYVHSGYIGDVELDGRTCHFRVVERLRGVVQQGDNLWIRPAGEGNRGNQIDNLRATESVFFNGRCYDLSFAFRPGDDQTPRLWCTLTEKEVPLAVLRLEGKHISRLVLGNQNMLVLPGLSEANMTVPVGHYQCKRMALTAGEYRNAYPHDFENISVTVAADAENTLKAGAPLNHQVQIRRTGKMLEFSYELVGLGGEHYDARQIAGHDSSKKPSVSIYKGDMKLATGEFEYG